MERKVKIISLHNQTCGLIIGSSFHSSRANVKRFQNALHLGWASQAHVI